jgi:hypothetical protein
MIQAEGANIMSKYRCLALAAMAIVAIGSEARALDEAPRQVIIEPRLTELTPATARQLGANGLLMSGLDQIGIGQGLEQAHINIFGHIEGSYTWNFDNPAQDLNLGRVFDVEHNKPLINQIDLNVARLVDLQSGQFDVGGRVEMLYGGDSRFIHSNGLLDGSDFFHGPDYQFDLPQAYVDVGIPLGNGVRLRLGKFLFFKQIDPNASVFYSHSFIFGGALPFTNTGATAFYPITQQFSVEGGISRGWDQSLKDNNGAIDGLARVRYSAGSNTDLSVAAIVGPELDGDNSHYRSTIDLALTQKVCPRGTVMVDAVYGYQAMPSGMTNAMWYGAAGYGVYQFNPYLAGGLRGECYRDEEALTTGLAQTLFEGTVGLTVTPFPSDQIGQNLKIRPEVRFDYSTRHYFDGATRHDQTTVAIDAIFNY